MNLNMVLGRRAVSALFCLLVGFPLTPWAQSTKPFSTEKEVFLVEMTEFIVGADKKEGKPFMEEVFAPIWNGPYYSEQQRVRIVQVANFMLKKRFDAFQGLPQQYYRIPDQEPGSCRIRYVVGRCGIASAKWTQAECGSVPEHLCEFVQGQHHVR